MSNINLIIGTGPTEKHPERYASIPVEGFAFSPETGLTFNGEALPAESQMFAVRYGLSQFLADATAAKKDEALTRDAAMERVNARVAKLVSGDLSRTRGEREPTNSVDALALQLAGTELRGLVRKASAEKQAAWKALSSEERAEKIAAYLSSDEARKTRLTAEAERQIAARQSAEPADLDGII